MHWMLLAAAIAASAISVPAEAQHRSGGQFGGGLSATSNHSGGDSGRHHDRRHHRDGGFAGPWGWSDGDWAYYHNRSFNSDSYNDWWHDRPDRAFPRWTQNNQNCDRLWWSGGGWRC